MNTKFATQIFDITFLHLSKELGAKWLYCDEIVKKSFCDVTSGWRIDELQTSYMFCTYL